MKHVNNYFLSHTPTFLLLFTSIILFSKCGEKNEKIINKNPSSTDVLPKEISFDQKIKILEQEMIMIDSTLAAEEKRGIEKDSLLVERLKELQLLKLELDKTIRNGNKSEQELSALKLQQKIEENKSKREIKMLTDSLKKLIATPYPNSNNSNVTSQQRINQLEKEKNDLLIKVNQLETRIRELEGRIIVRGFSVQAVRADGKTPAKKLSSIDHFKVTFQSNNKIETSKIYYEVKRDGISFDITKNSDGTKIIPIKKKSMEKGNYEFVMKYAGEIIARTNIDLKRQIEL